MFIRAFIYFLLLVLFCEGIAITAIGWSFFETSRSSLTLLKYTSDNKARDILAAIARVGETKMTPDGIQEMNDLLVRIKKQTEKDLDKFGIVEMFLLSENGKILAHTNKEEIAIPLKERPVLDKYNKPFFMRALRMRKGQLPYPQDYGEPWNGDGTRFQTLVLTLFPDLKSQTVAISSPVYHLKKLETVASMHMIYSRGNLLFYMDRQKELLLWLTINYSVIGFIASVILGLIFLLFSILTRKQGVNEGRKVVVKDGMPLPPVVERLPVQMINSPSVIPTAKEESIAEKISPVSPLPMTEKKNEVLDAIYLG
ncbi:MAG: hypothetical protein K8R21_09155 [Leptospira sp.]|nr:hypothetical protein [Leptospira sp.]